MVTAGGSCLQVASWGGWASRNPSSEARPHQKNSPLDPAFLPPACNSPTARPRPPPFFNVSFIASLQPPWPDSLCRWQPHLRAGYSALRLRHPAAKPTPVKGMAGEQTLRHGPPPASRPPDAMGTACPVVVIPRPQAQGRPRTKDEGSATHRRHTAGSRPSSSLGVWCSQAR